MLIALLFNFVMYRYMLLFDLILVVSIAVFVRLDIETLI